MKNYTTSRLVCLRQNGDIFQEEGYNFKNSKINFLKEIPHSLFSIPTRGNYAGNHCKRLFEHLDLRN